MHRNSNDDNVISTIDSLMMHLSIEGRHEDNEDMTSGYSRTEVEGEQVHRRCRGGVDQLVQDGEEWIGE